MGVSVPDKSYWISVVKRKRQNENKQTNELREEKLKEKKRFRGFLKPTDSKSIHYLASLVRNQ